MCTGQAQYEKKVNIKDHTWDVPLWGRVYNTLTTLEESGASYCVLLWRYARALVLPATSIIYSYWQLLFKMLLNCRCQGFSLGLSACKARVQATALLPLPAEHTEVGESMRSLPWCICPTGKGKERFPDGPCWPSGWALPALVSFHSCPPPPPLSHPFSSCCGRSSRLRVERICWMVRTRLATRRFLRLNDIKSKEIQSLIHSESRVSHKACDRVECLPRHSQAPLWNGVLVPLQVNLLGGDGIVWALLFDMQPEDHFKIPSPVAPSPPWLLELATSSLVSATPLHYQSIMWLPAALTKRGRWIRYLPGAGASSKGWENGDHLVSLWLGWQLN